ncbi:threonine ammonia-lyase [Niveispirillum sp. KHB5.9]|uniref:threonine ammonia-lyase n=1 Tax=Niveispirillum sp. KHB5.9 TaxID=3400269 RepID=UPI003A8C67C8
MLEDVEAASARIAGHVRRTPILSLRGGLGLKAESLQPTGSFKIRGAFNTILGLSATQRAAGVVTHSSGNHGQAVAYAAARLGVRAVIVMPDDAPLAKLDGIRHWGAEVVTVAAASAERAARAHEIAAAAGSSLVEPYDSDAVIAATGTIGEEILADRPDTRQVFVAVGGGGLASGLARALKHRNPTIRVIGVEPELAADAQESKMLGAVVSWPGERTGRTLADGLRVQQLGDLNWPLIRDHVDHIVTVGEAQILRAIRQIALEAKLVAEPSGAVAIAAALAAGAGEGDVAILSGGNLDPGLLAEAMAC